MSRAFEKSPSLPRLLFAASFAFAFAFIVLLCGVYALPAFANHYGPWEVYTGIDGIGQITKTGPANYNNLHYDGPYTEPEIAYFALGHDGEEDIDRRAVYDDCWQFIGWDEQDAGVDLDNISWGCEGAGRMIKTGWAAAFVPNNEVHEDINISVALPDGPNYNSEDDDAVRVWGETLNTFMVGIEIGLCEMETYWEDDPDPSLTWEDLEEFSSLEVDVQTTTLGTPGKVTPDSATTNVRTFFWKAIAATASENITHIQETIKFTPSLSGGGHINLYGETDAPHVTGSTEISVSFTAQVSPYASASVSYGISQPNLCTACDGLLSGNSVIELISVKEVKTEMEHSHGNGYYGQLAASQLAISGPLGVTPNTQIDGSYEIEVMASGEDNSACFNIHTWTTTPDDAATEHMSWGCTRPTY